MPTHLRQCVTVPKGHSPCLRDQPLPKAANILPDWRQSVAERLRSDAGCRRESSLVEMHRNGILVDGIKGST